MLLNLCCSFFSSHDGRMVKKRAVNRREVTALMFWRYKISLERDKVCSFFATQVRKESTSESNASTTKHLLPGWQDCPFLIELSNTVTREFEDRLHPHARTVTPDLYSLWVMTSHITVELFADSLNEIGVLASYCSNDRCDCVLGSCGSWQDVEEIVEGAGGNPPFETTFLNRMIDEFDKGCQGTRPYCRCVILPLGKSHGIMERTRRLSSKAIMFVHIPAGCLSFKHQEGFFKYYSQPHHHAFQDLGVFVWRNREYLDKCPPLRDVELLYMK